MSNNRRTNVIEFPVLSVSDMQDTLRGSVGLVSSLVIVPLLLSEAGQAYTGAAGGTTIVQSQTTWDLEDARIDQIRLVGFGSANAGGTSVRLKMGSTVLGTASLANGAVARFTGAWTTVYPASGDQTYVAEVVGNGVATETLHRLEVHARTLRVGTR